VLVNLTISWDIDTMNKIVIKAYDFVPSGSEVIPCEKAESIPDHYNDPFLPRMFFDSANISLKFG